MTEVAVLAVLAAAVALAAWVLRAREGRIVAVEAQLAGAVRDRLGIPAGAPALVEFTAPGCGTCTAARAVLDGVAARHAGVLVIAADVGGHIDLAREHGVLRAPTTLVVDAHGRVRHRIHGVPDAGALDAVLRADPHALAAGLPDAGARGGIEGAHDGVQGAHGGIEGAHGGVQGAHGGVQRAGPPGAAGGQ